MVTRTRPMTLDGPHSWVASGDQAVTLASLAGFSFAVSDLWR